MAVRDLKIRWWIPLVAVAAAWLLALSGNCAAQSIGFPNAAVRDSLSKFSSDSIEHLVCLDGRAIGDTVYFDAMRIPEQQASAHGVTVQGTHTGCGSALAVWHNHPKQAGETAEMGLYFSSSDQNTFLRYEEALFAIVGVDGAMCLWTRRQVHAGWLLNLTPLPPIEKQCWQTH